MSYRYLFYLLPLLLCYSCSRRYFAPAIYGNDISYQPKPASFDKVKSAGYISGGLAVNQGISDANSISFGELDLSAGHVFNNVNVAYGAFGFAGTIDNSNHSNETTDSNSFSSEGFGGVGGRVSVNLFTSTGNVEFRYFGVEGSYSKEFGDYAAYRRSVQNIEGYNTTSQTEVVTIGGTSEILWHRASDVNSRFGFRLFIGKTLGNQDYLKSSDYYRTFEVIPVYTAVSYFMQIKHIFGVAEITRNLSPVSGFRVKIGYQF